MFKRSVGNIRIQLFRSGSVCGDGAGDSDSDENDFGNFTASTALECARGCLQRWPNTQYIEFQASAQDCDCDGNKLGNCSPIRASGWNVYLILTSGSSVAATVCRSTRNSNVTA